MRRAAKIAEANKHLTPKEDAEAAENKVNSFSTSQSEDLPRFNPGPYLNESPRDCSSAVPLIPTPAASIMIPPAILAANHSQSQKHASDCLCMDHYPLLKVSETLGKSN